MQHLQQRLHAASSDRTAELEHGQQLNRSLKAEIAALQNRLSGFADIDHDTQPQGSGAAGSGAAGGAGGQHLELFGSCLLVDPASSLAQNLPQLHGGNGAPYLAANRLASIPEGDGSQSAPTSMQGDEVSQDGGMHLVPQLQSQVRALAASLHDKTQEAETLHLAMDQLKNEVGSSMCCSHEHHLHFLYKLSSLRIDQWMLRSPELHWLLSVYEVASTTLLLSLRCKSTGQVSNLPG